MLLFFYLLLKSLKMDKIYGILIQKKILQEFYV